MKGLIYEAYYKGALPLLHVVPFAAHVMRGAIVSVVFRPPISWTMAIFRVLRELHDMPNVRGGIKFETRVAMLTQSVFPQIEPMAHIPQQFLPYVSALGFSVGAATSGAIGGAISVSQVASAPQMMHPHQLR
uniref:CNOT1_CAF1_bind domain-containing protein n=1 Tax=Mesocestoides corti TaxID=53468 RepID=A0A5K3FZW8_MESCO